MLMDLVMWVKNSEKTLPLCLESIERAIPQNSVNQKIFVDGGSTDKSPEIAGRYGWRIYDLPGQGIPEAANEALRHVETPFFASFEADVILTRRWFRQITPWMADPNVAVAQGVRLPTNPVLSALDVTLQTDEISPSMDNNIFRTEVVKELDGFPAMCPICSDTILMKKMLFETGYKWIIDRGVVSWHIRDDLKDAARHQMRLISKCEATPYCSGVGYFGERSKTWRLAVSVLTAPFIVILTAVRKKTPQCVWEYPLWRHYYLKERLKMPRRRKTISPPLGIFRMKGSEVVCVDANRYWVP